MSGRHMPACMLCSMSDAVCYQQHQALPHNQLAGYSEYDIYLQLHASKLALKLPCMWLRRCTDTITKAVNSPNVCEVD